jgi:hypothetical protein
MTREYIFVLNVDQFRTELVPAMHEFSIRRSASRLRSLIWKASRRHRSIDAVATTSSRLLIPRNPEKLSLPFGEGAELYQTSDVETNLRTLRSVVISEQHETERQTTVSILEQALSSPNYALGMVAF